MASLARASAPDFREQSAREAHRRADALLGLALVATLGLLAAAFWALVACLTTYGGALGSQLGLP